MQPDNHATRQPMQPWNQATIQPYNQATKQPSNQATMQPSNHIIICEIRLIWWLKVTKGGLEVEVSILDIFWRLIMLIMQNWDFSGTWILLQMLLPI